MVPTLIPVNAAASVRVSLSALGPVGRGSEPEWHLSMPIVTRCLAANNSMNLRH